jgi:hypothetical protein
MYILYTGRTSAQGTAWHNAEAGRLKIEQVPAPATFQFRVEHLPRRDSIMPWLPDHAIRPRTGPFRPLRENDHEYVFAYFCGDSPTAIEVPVPKEKPERFRPACQQIVSVERDASGPFLDTNNPKTHTAAKPRN